MIRSMFIRSKSIDETHGDLGTRLGIHVGGLKADANDKGRPMNEYGDLNSGLDFLSSIIR